MEISEKKTQIVINNYFKQECDVNTSIRDAFEKGFRIGVKKALSAQPDYTEMRQEFLRMASYIDVLLECSDEQREALIGFISRLAEFMPWTERD